jgi:hypothetical protein
MKFTGIAGSLTLAALTSLSLTAFAQSKPTGDVEKFFREVDALAGKHDAGAFERLLTDDFTFIVVNGAVLDRKEVLERLKAGHLFAGTPNEILNIHVYGETAIVTYRSRTPLNGGTDLLGTRVFVKQAGVWKWAFSQGTLVGGALPAVR